MSDNHGREQEGENMADDLLAKFEQVEDSMASDILSVKAKEEMSASKGIRESDKDLVGNTILLNNKGKFQGSNGPDRKKRNTKADESKVRADFVEEIVLWKQLDKRASIAAKNDRKERNVFFEDFESKILDLQKGLTIFFSYCPRVRRLRIGKKLDFFTNIMKQYWSHLPVKLHKDYYCDVSADRNHKISVVLRWEMGTKSLSNKKKLMRLIYRLKSKNERKNIHVGVYMSSTRIERSTEMGLRVTFINKELELPPLPAMEMASSLYVARKSLTKFMTLKDILRASGPEFDNHQCHR